MHSEAIAKLAETYETYFRECSSADDLRNYGRMIVDGLTQEKFNNEVWPHLLDNPDRGHVFRAWVAGVGEEVVQSIVYNIVVKLAEVKL